MEYPSVLDLTFATQGLVNQVEDWQILPDLGSDHFGVLFTITYTSSSISTSPLKVPRYNTKKANWVQFNKSLSICFQDFNFNLNSKYTNQELDNLGELFTSNIIYAANDSIPRAYKSIASKP